MIAIIKHIFVSCALSEKRDTNAEPTEEKYVS